MFSKEELTRYSRHILLPEIRKAGQERLKKSQVFVIGAGGLGSPVLIYLAAAGVGNIRFADFDTLDLSNLQRQILYQTSDLDSQKVYSAARQLRKLNPHIQIEPIPDRMTAENIMDHIRDSDIVIETTDNFESKFLSNDACFFLKKPLITGGILRFEGQVFCIQPGKTPCYRCVFHEPPPPSAVPNCSQAGVLGAIAGIIGSIQAAEALKYLTQAGEPPFGKLLLADILKSEYRTIQPSMNPNCPLCGESPTILNIKSVDYAPNNSCPS